LKYEKNRLSHFLLLGEGDMNYSTSNQV
jgi:hypothetical protein